MEHINWSQVVYNQSERKLVLINQNLSLIPQSVINVYCNKLSYLDVSSNRINDLSFLRLMPCLETLILDNNAITDDVLLNFNSDGNSLETVKILSINNNKLENLTLILLILASEFPNLEHLSLLGNPACPDGLSPNKSSSDSYDSYKRQVSHSFRHLKFLDSCEIQRHFNGSVTQRRAEILKFSPKILFAKLKGTNEVKYTPLPSNKRNPGDHCGSYSLTLYKYIGRNSEGNRFILNNDL
ncbi:leucine-rich melanocyte differentiation-associated protein isoform X1 [Hermetia illucens]|nr:leucine-rich melanocyte differentiation-associated protein isoform X1 [Hermetia illucens]